MAAKFTIGQAVRQIIKPIEGTISERIIVGDDDVYKVSRPDEDGGVLETYLKESELEEV
jgi:heat shock protein HspQ